MQKPFFEWLDRILQTMPLPDEVVAVNFNLYEESEGLPFAVQIVGTVSFDAENDDWACDAVYSSEEDLFAFEAEEWENALELASQWVSAYVEEGAFSALLKGMEAVAIGFVDGDLEVLYRNID